jgi:signal transduction histidine kinase
VFILIVSPIVDAQGRTVGASASMRDISTRKRLSQELARSRRMAALGKMAGGVAHHFNNILGGMLTSIDYALPSDSPRELRRTLRLLAQAIGRATRITRQLSAFATAETELQESADLNRLMSGFCEKMRRETSAAGIRLVTDVRPVAPCPFEVQRMLPVLESLAQNAMDAMTVDGTLRIEMVQQDQEALITIADTGCGMSEQEMEHLFEPFYTTKGELGGGSSDNIGLGLAAVHGLVAEMGGSIKISSTVGRGTEVRLLLPLTPREAGPGGVEATGTGAGGSPPAGGAT